MSIVFFNNWHPSAVNSMETMESFPTTLDELVVELLGHETNNARLQTTLG